MTFADALLLLRGGWSLRRESWLPDCFVKLDMQTLYFFDTIDEAATMVHEWHAASADLLAFDWVVA